MSEGTNDTEKKGSVKQKPNLKNNKLDLKSKLDNVDLGVTMPSTNVQEYLRVLRLARKPNREEFNMIAKISMAGIGIIGTLGFVIYALLTELPKAF
jgi:protein transport protein SEC61 subunit gamma-like protein